MASKYGLAVFVCVCVVFVRFLSLLCHITHSHMCTAHTYTNTKKWYTHKYMNAAAIPSSTNLNIWRSKQTNKQTNSLTKHTHTHMSPYFKPFSSANPSIPDENSLVRCPLWPDRLWRLISRFFFVNKVNGKIGNLPAKWIIKLKCVCARAYVCVHIHVLIYIDQ